MLTPRFLLIGLLATTLAASPALAGYVGGGTFVVKSDGITAVDNGGVVCQGMNGDGIGGGCLSFPLPGPLERASFIRVNDNAAGLNVAFQVCIDNNGDGICGGPQTNERCRDQIFFSHADGGKFFNALGPLPTSALQGCPQAFKGYVVLLCEGEHNDRQTGPHTHSLTTGSITRAEFGSGYGDFCGGNGGTGTPSGGFVDAAAKAYRVI